MVDRGGVNSTEERYRPESLQQDGRNSWKTKIREKGNEVL